MPDGFILKNEDMRRLEGELAALDPALREVAGASARIDRLLLGSTGRLVEARRSDGIEFGVAICAMLRGPLTEAPVRYLVVPFARYKMAGAPREWRNVPQWTIELANAESLEQARAAIAEAWNRAATVSRDEIGASSVKDITAGAPEVEK